ncbi:MAG TPA: uroporphyrinogen-III synthase, partial [Nitrospirales bacterium]|nr:uroporphyrinogen-III synthase [Nitrospirales bacterium]
VPAMSFDGLRVVAFESRMATEMARLIERHGGRPMLAPAMREVPLTDNHEALAFGARLLAQEFDLIIFLTGVGTRALFDVLATRYPIEQIIGALKRATLVVRGPKPAAALKAMGLTGMLTVPEPNTWRDVLASLDAAHGTTLTGRRIAVQDYGVPNDELLAGLRQRGATVTHVPIYRWALPEDLGPLRAAIETLRRGEGDVMLITNAVQIEHVVQVAAQNGAGAVTDLTRALRRTVIGSIGPTASERLRRHSLPPDFEPSHPKMGLLVKELSERVHPLLAQKRASAS